MSEGKRPGGLTALAVINFVFGGFGALGLLVMGAAFALMGAASSGTEGGEAENDPAQAMAQAWEQIGSGFFIVVLAVGALSTILMIASGVGYLQQKKFLGRGLGNGYAVLSIIQSLVMALLVVNPDAGGGFQMMTMVGLVYPVLTLVLLNTTFKEDFIR